MNKRRSYSVMINQILEIVRHDERVHLVTLEGSRTNKNVKKDKYQDYDITFVVSEMNSFLDSDEWLDKFGKIIFIQKPEDMELYKPELGNWFSYLMLFDDLNRIDLTLVPLNELQLYLESDKLIEVLLDKHKIIDHKVIASDEDYHIKKPTEKEFDDCCNEFWWVVTYVDKGIRRNEFLFAADHLNKIVRKELIRMISWKIGYETNYSLSIGKNAKYIKDYISVELYKGLLNTFDMSSLEKVRNSLNQCMELFSNISKNVSSELEYQYPNYEQNIKWYLSQLEEEE